MAQNLAVCFELTKILVTICQLVFLDMHEYLS